MPLWSTSTIPRLIADLPISVTRVFLGVDSGDHALRKRDSIRTLKCFSAAFERELLSREAIISSMVDSDRNIRRDPLHSTKAGVVADLDTQDLLFSRIASIILTCSPSLVAELKQWQKAAHVLACIDTAVSYLTRAMKQPADSLVDRICEAMVATIFAFPPPPQATRPAEERPDDRERVMDRVVFYDEPYMQTLMSSLGDNDCLFLKSAADRERSHLPLFPACFRYLDPVTAILGFSKSDGLDEKAAL